MEKLVISETVFYKLYSLAIETKREPEAVLDGSLALFELCLREFQKGNGIGIVDRNGNLIKEDIGLKLV